MTNDTEVRAASPHAREDARLARIVLIAAALVAIVAVILAVRRPAPSGAPAAPATAAPAKAGSDEVARVIGQLEERLRTHPDDAQGWRLLGWAYFQTQRFSDAVAAYRRATTLEPDNAEGWSALGEAMSLASDGTVPPDAEAAFRKALALDARDARARYFMALRKDIAGDHKGAIDDWIALLKDAPAGAPWERNVRQTIDQAARKNGIDVSGRVPPPAATQANPAAGGDGSGPSSEQAAAIAAMPPAQQQALIRSMVGRLDARLKSNPRDGEGWLRLMQARMVLGEPEAATRAYRDGSAALAGDEAAQARLREAARTFGVPGV